MSNGLSGTVVFLIPYHPLAVTVRVFVLVRYLLSGTHQSHVPMHAKSGKVTIADALLERSQMVN